MNTTKLKTKKLIFLVNCFQQKLLFTYRKKTNFRFRKTTNLSTELYQSDFCSYSPHSIEINNVKKIEELLIPPADSYISLQVSYSFIRHEIT